MSEPDLVRISIIGLGLIGGSIGLALKEADPSLVVTGCARRPETAARAMARGAIDRAAATPAEAVAEAGLVIIATPVLSIRDLFRELAPHLPCGCVVSDAASTKAQVMQWAGELLPAGVDFIGGHPMAGKETAGIEAAEPGLFRKTVYCLVPSPKASHQSVDMMTGFVDSLGAMPYFIEAGEHDALVAGISHLPLLLSVALVAATTKDPRWEKMSKLAASGYRDMTRLAAGSARVYADICLTNQPAILSWLDEYVGVLQGLRGMVSAGGEALERALEQASEAREKWLKSRQK